jgi:hypothetical protein
MITEADILDELVGGDQPDLNPETARSFLKLRFTKATKKQIGQLLRKNNRGTIMAAERVVLEKYLRVGQFLDLLHAKARISLQRAGKKR